MKGSEGRTSAARWSVKKRVGRSDEVTRPLLCSLDKDAAKDASEADWKPICISQVNQFSSSTHLVESLETLKTKHINFLVNKIASLKIATSLHNPLKSPTKHLQG